MAWDGIISRAGPGLGVLVLLLLLPHCPAHGYGRQTLHHEAATSLHRTVGGGNYTYTLINDPIPVTLVLHSLSGDADLYISDVLKEPTFDLESHLASAASCGVDRLDLPIHLGRPIYIGVYGHPYYETSEFILTAASLGEEDRYMVEDSYDRGDGAKAEDWPKERMARSEGHAHDVHEDEFPHSSPLYDFITFLLQLLLEILT